LIVWGAALALSRSARPLNGAHAEASEQLHLQRLDNHR